MTFPELIPLAAAICNLIVSLFVISRGLRSTVTYVYLLWGTCITIWNTGTYFMFRVDNAEQALFWARFLQFGVIFIPVSLFHVSLLIAQIPVRRYVYFFYAFNGILALTNFTDFFIPEVRKVSYAWYSVAGPGFYIFSISYFLTFASIIILFRRRRQLPPFHRTRLNYLIFAQTLLVTLGTNDILPILGIDYYPFIHAQIFPFGSLAAIFYGIIVAYTVVQFQMLDIHVTLSRLAAQSVRLIFAIVLGFALLLLAFQFTPPTPNEAGGIVSTYFVVCMLVLIATVLTASLLFPRLFGTGSDRIERRILGDRFEYQDKINGFIQSVPWFPDTEMLLDDLHDLLLHTIRARSYQLVLLDEQRREFTLLRSHPVTNSALVSGFQRDSPVFRYFRRSRADYLHLSSPMPHPGSSSLEAEAQSQLQPFDAEFCFPFFSEEDPVGLLLLGPKNGSEPYTPYDLHLFSSLVRNINLIINQLRLKKQVLLAEEMELLGRMSRGMAHDLNNLITPVWTFLQLVREGLAVDTAKDELLPTAIRNVEAIRQYVKESLFYSTTLTPHFRTCRLNDCVTKAVELVLPQLRSKNVTARIENLPQVEVEIDFILIQRLLCNLLGNACDASPAGGQIEVRILPLAKTEVGRDWHRVLVTDHGEGISAENLKHIFRPYFTTKDRGSRRGFGLGLAICRKIVHLHGGNLNVESQLHRGTTVMMDLPSRQLEKPAAKPKPELVATP